MRTIEIEKIIEMYWLDKYIINWDKVTTLEDIKKILSETDIYFEPDNPAIDRLKDFLIRVKK